MCCHILAKSINFTYDTLRWFAMRYGYHTMKWKALAHRTRISIAGAPDQQCFPQTPDVFLSLHIPSTSIQSLPPYYLFTAGKNRTHGPPIRDNLSSRMAAFLSLSMDTGIRASGLAVIPLAFRDSRIRRPARSGWTRQHLAEA